MFDTLARSARPGTMARHGIVMAVVAAVASGAGAAPDGTGGPGAATVITAVWRQPFACATPPPSTPPGSAPAALPALPRTADPDADAIRRNRLVPLPRARLQFHVPALAGLDAVVLRLTADDRSRGVADDYLLLAPTTDADPVAAVVVTELPKGFDSPARIFETVVSTERRLAAGTGTFPTFDRSDGPYGDTLEMRVPGRTSSACFPTGRFATGTAGPTTTFGISRFVQVRGRLVEFALIVPLPAAMTLDDQVGRAQAAMDAFWGGLSLD